MASLHLTLGNKNYSSWSMRPWLALDASGLPFTETVRNLFTEETSAWLRAHAPAARVPVLEIDGVFVWDSLAIIERVAELAPAAALWPQDPVARSVARSVSAEMHAGFTALRQHLPMNIRARFPGFQVPPAARPEIERVQALWEDALRRFGGGGPYLFGAFSAADCMFAPVATRFVTYDVSLSLAAGDYCAAVLAHPSVVRWIEAATSEPWRIDRYDSLLNAGPNG